MLADEPFARALQSLETCVLVNNNLCGKLVLSLELPTTFDESFKITSLPFFVPDFNLSSFTILCLKCYVVLFCINIVCININIICFFNNEKQYCIFISFSS